MRKWCVLGVALAMAGTAYAAPNVTNATQKGSLLVWPDVRVDPGWRTLVRIQNDGSQDVDVICYWMDGHKNRVDFVITVTRNQPFWFDAGSGRGSSQVNPFPQSPANGFVNPFLPGPQIYRKGLLACWAVDGGAQNQVKWNHLSGTATLYTAESAYEYNAYAFYAPLGNDLAPIGSPGTLNMNGVEYDSCPIYQIGQFSPGPQPGVSAPPIRGTRLVLAGCTLQFQQDWEPVWTKWTFDLWNEDEVKFTGAFECADSWHETFFGDDIDSASQNFQFPTLGTYAARYRVQGIKSQECEDLSAKPARITEAVGVLAVQVTALAFGAGAAPDTELVATTLAAAGKFNGRIVWDPEGAVPEGGIR